MKHAVTSTLPEYPYTITNGGGESLTFLRRGHDAHGEYLECENCIEPGAGPPMHAHVFQEEGGTVRAGRVGLQRAGEAPRYAGEGESFVFRAGEAHRFWNAGDQPLVVACYIRPPDNIEYFLGALFDSQRRNGGKRPSPLEVALLCRHFQSEFHAMVLPPLAQRLLFPPMALVARGLGRHHRYGGAPEPRRA